MFSANGRSNYELIFFFTCKYRFRHCYRFKSIDLASEKPKQYPTLANGLSIPLSVYVCVVSYACGGGVLLFSNNNRIIPGDFRILFLPEMPLPTLYTVHFQI